MRIICVLFLVSLGLTQGQCNGFNRTADLICPDLSASNHVLELTPSIQRPTSGTKKVTFSIPNLNFAAGKGLVLKRLQTTPISGYGERVNNGWRIVLFVPRSAQPGSHFLAVDKITGDSPCNVTGISEGDYYRMLARTLQVTAGILRGTNDTSCTDSGKIPAANAPAEQWNQFLQQIDACFNSTRGSQLRKPVSKQCYTSAAQTRLKVTVN